MQVLATREQKEFVSEDAMLTVHDWDALPDTKPRYELVDGKLVQKMITTNAHAWAAGELVFALKSWGRERGWRFMPEGTGVRLDSRNGAVPDAVGFASQQSLAPLDTHNEAPFLVAEVLSPSTAQRDRTSKKARYAAIGVALYLIVDTANRTMEVFRPVPTAQGEPASLRYGDAEVLGENDFWAPPELPDFTLSLSSLWL